MPKEPKPKSPVVGPTPALPASVEESYRQKCKEIKKRIVEIESSNDVLTSRIQRARRAIQRMRLERAFLLEQLEKRTDARVDDSEGSPSPPPTPSNKPLRVKRPRKDAPPVDSPMRQASESPTRDNGARAGDPDYPFTNQPFTATESAPPPYTLPANAATVTTATTATTATAAATITATNAATATAAAPNKSSKGAATRSYGYRTRGGPKRPPNAYMIFCERERDAVRERESSKDDFDMHKALAQAWRDLKHEGQKPYFEEYERNKASYTAKVNEMREQPNDKRSLPEPESDDGAGGTNDDEADGQTPR